MNASDQNVSVYATVSVSAGCLSPGKCALMARSGTLYGTEVKTYPRLPYAVPVDVS